MRLRAVYLLAAVASVAAVLVVAGPANATANWSCGETFATSPGTLDNNLDCSGYTENALVITADGVTLNFGGHTVTVDGTADWDGVYNDGYTGLTVENGTINMDTGGTAVEGYGVANDGGLGLTVADMTINGGYYGVDSYSSSDGTTVEGSTISGSTDEGIYQRGNGATIDGNTISPASGAQGIEATHGLGDVVSNNTVTGNFDGTDYIDGDIGIHLHLDTAALVEDNTVTTEGSDAMYESWDSGTQVTDNTFDGNYDGLDINGEIGPNSNESISGNFIRNSYYEGVYDYESDMNTYTGNVLSNNGIECGTSPTDSSCSGFYIDPDDQGSVTMTNNYSRLSSWGYYVEDAYNDDSYAATRSMFSGNSATYNDYGYYDDYSVLATWSDNTAYGSNDDGFTFDAPNHETITGNSSMHNGGEGFYFEDNAAADNPLSVTNNVGEYNGDYGFYADDPLAASSGNTGSNTNGSDDCWFVSGCS
ncbi:MAG TPA: right-handed parallel beta-helix repeat-containing protein [Gaiellaceae bacterium]|nr:right-handed parallel beta-helix repeat-containing protein [Gaiellaceae bacterium]